MNNCLIATDNEVKATGGVVNLLLVSDQRLQQNYDNSSMTGSELLREYGYL